MDLPLAPFKRILQKAGAKRVSDEALEELSSAVEEKIYKIAQEAVLLARHAGRKTILPEDVRLAKRKV